MSKAKPSQAFTIIELAVLLLVIGLLALCLLPALARSEPDVQKILCLNAKRQLCSAWRLYADDNADKLVTIVHGGLNQGGVGKGSFASWAEGWLDWSTSADNTNGIFLIDPRYAKLAPYVRGATNLFKCPADKYLSPVQKARGWTQRVRSVSANIGIGEGNAEVGPWAPIYKHIRKISEFRYPTPAEAWVFLDEHPDSINDPAFFSPNQTSWIDLPAVYHYGSGSFGFADCHAEIHKWRGSLANVKNYYGDFPGIPSPAGDPDLNWMSYHAPRISNDSY